MQTNNYPSNYSKSNKKYKNVIVIAFTLAVLVLIGFVSLGGEKILLSFSADGILSEDASVVLFHVQAITILTLISLTLIIAISIFRFKQIVNIYKTGGGTYRKIIIPVGCMCALLPMIVIPYEYFNQFYYSQTVTISDIFFVIHRDGKYYILLFCISTILCILISFHLLVKTNTIRSKILFALINTIALIMHNLQCITGKIKSMKSGFKLPTLLSSFAVIAVFNFLLLYFFVPLWHNCDDVFLSMATHGYGAFEKGTNLLFFQNVIWGFLVRSIPELDGTLGYSTAIFIIITLSVTLILYGLIKSGITTRSSLLITWMILIPSFLRPQFTITAGLAAVAAIVCWKVYGEKKTRLALTFGCILAFLGFLTRWKMFLLIMCIGLPLLPWRKYKIAGFAKIETILLCVAVAFAIIVDYQSYQASEWGKISRPPANPNAIIGLWRC